MIVLSAAILWAADAHAQDNNAFPNFSFSGFGTVGVVRSSEEKANYVAHDLQGGGAGRDKEWSADVDSRLGVQVTAAFTPQLSAVLQVVTEQDYDGSFRPDVEWANIKYDLTPDFSVRVGRVVLGSFLATDYRKVGYAQHWVRPPVEVYGLIPMTHSDGVDLSYRVRWGDVSHNLQAAFGDFEEHVPAGQKVKSDNGWTLSDTIEYGPATLRLTYSRSRFSIETLQPLWNGYRDIANNPLLQFVAPATVAAANRILDEYDTMDTKSTFVGVGASYDPGKWFVMSEWGQTDTNSAFGKRSAWYVSGGYRIGQFTPYASFAKAKLHTRDSDPGVPIPGFIPLADQIAMAQANAALNEVLAGATVQRTFSVGVRWDFAKNAAFKLQYDHSRMGDNSPGTLVDPLPGFKTGGRYDVFSATVDFVF